MSRLLSLSTLVCLCVVTGCSSSYKMVKKSQVRVVAAKGGERITVITAPYIAFKEVIERSPNVKSVTRITDLKGCKEPARFTVSPSDPVLVYQAIEEINGQRVSHLYQTSTYCASGVTRLTTGGYFDIEPQFSENGKVLLFSSNRSSVLPNIYKISAKRASGITRLTHSNSIDRFPCVNNDGSAIYYMSKPVGDYLWQVWCINKDGSFPTQIKEGHCPRISHDGRKIVYCVLDENTGKSNIWTMNVDGTEQTQLTMDVDADNIHPAWSPKDNVIAFASDAGKDSNGKRNFDVWVMGANGAGKTQLSTNGSTDVMPEFGPEGENIYFLSNRGFNWDIWRMKIF